MPEQHRTEIRDGREFTVTVLPKGARAASRNAPPKKGKGTKTCGGCGFVGIPGKRWRIRGQWVRCPSCVTLYSQTKKEQRESALLADGKAVRTNAGTVELGWNGVPSERSLRRRSQ